MNLVPLEQLNYESFARLVKTGLCVRLDADHSLSLTLLEVTPRRVVSADGTNARSFENFSLMFLGPADRPLPQQIYQFEAAEIGRFELFIVPCHRSPEGIRYQAIFNRLVPQ